MTYTPNYNLILVEGTDVVNPLVQLNPNISDIDTQMKANADATISSATCIKSGTTHTIVRSNPDANVLRFTATGDWITGDTMIVDGVTVTPYLVTGEALKTGAYLINTEVLMAVQGSRATVYSNQSEAQTTGFSDANVIFTASNVQAAIEEAATAAGTEYESGTSVRNKIGSMDMQGSANQWSPTDNANVPVNNRNVYKKGNGLLILWFGIRLNAALAAGSEVMIVDDVNGLFGCSVTGNAHRVFGCTDNGTTFVIRQFDNKLYVKAVSAALTTGSSDTVYACLPISIS